MIPRFKIGICNCPECNGMETECVKVGKTLWCIQSYRKEKAKQYEAKSREKNKVRSLGREQVKVGNYFEAERAALIQDLDFVTSRIVRLMAANEMGIIHCYCCGKPIHWSLAQCMHFIPRSIMALRFDIRRNLRAGCKHCNEVLNGNLKVYAERLEHEQKGLPEQLNEEAREVYHWSREELKMLLIDLRAKYNLIEKDKK